MRLVTDHRDWYPTTVWSWLARSPLTRWLLRPLGSHVAPQPFAVRVDDHGIHALYVDGPERLIPWAAVGEVETGRRELLLEIDGGRIAWPMTWDYSYGLWKVIHGRLHPEPELETRIEPETIAHWLGIPVDGRLVVKGNRTWRRLMIFALVASLPSAIEYGQWGTFLSIALMGWLSGWMWQRSAPVVATPYGLRRGRRLIPWTDVTSARRIPNPILDTRDGDVDLGRGPAADRLADTVSKLLVARFEGAAPARMTDIPDHALSRAESVEVSAERGISPAEDGP